MVLKNGALPAARCATFALLTGRRKFATRPEKRSRHDNKSLREQQVPGVRAFCLHRGHALRALPV
jgi:hypothetical protein